MSSNAATERTRQFYEREAAKYDRRVQFFERLLFGDGRQWVCSQAEGEVLEIALGTGRNLPFYADDVRLTGVELSPAMLEIARKRAADLGREADLRVGDAESLAFPAERFDTVVCTLSLCTIPNDRAAVAEVVWAAALGALLREARRAERWEKNSRSTTVSSREAWSARWRTSRAALRPERCCREPWCQ